jgi:hypothetical protein
MTTAAPSTALATIQPIFADSGARHWTDTGVQVQGGDRLGLMASEVVHIGGDYPAFAPGRAETRPAFACAPARGTRSPAPYPACLR